MVEWRERWTDGRTEMDERTGRDGLQGYAIEMKPYKMKPFITVAATKRIKKALNERIKH